jgi:pimeloyl-ACP methyl ester carboxylesterase
LDFFTLDYNDDFSAFHGQTLLDQSEYLADSIRYILSLYPSTAERPDPSSVIVVAHSMGGVVARAAIQHRNYQSFSISTLITIATPHIVPPVTVDRGVDTVYDSISRFWREGYDLEPLQGPPASPSEGYKRSRARAELADLVLISISGGISDVTIASESASLASILPLNDSHGFTVYTTAIPGVQTPIDHLAILWCQQLMSVVAHAMLSIVDVRTPQGVIPRQERVEKLSESLLGALDSRPRQLNGRKVGLETLERGLPSRVLEVGERLVVRNEEGRRADSERRTYLLPVPAITTLGSTSVFSLLTSASIGRGKESAIEVYACAISAAGDVETLQGSSSCTPLFPHHVTAIPVSPHGPVSPPLPAPNEDGTMSLVSVDAAQLETVDAIAVIVKTGQAWVLAEFGDREKRVQLVDKSATGELLFRAVSPTF